MDMWAGTNPELALVIFRDVAASYAYRPHIFIDSSLVQEEVSCGIFGREGVCGIFPQLMSCCKHVDMETDIGLIYSQILQDVCPP